MSQWLVTMKVYCSRMSHPDVVGGWEEICCTQLPKDLGNRGEPPAPTHGIWVVAEGDLKERVQGSWFMGQAWKWYPSCHCAEPACGL